jgi:hypothetical protein
MSSAWPFSLARRPFFFSVAFVLALSPTVQAGGESKPCGLPAAGELRRLTAEELEQWFAQGRVDNLPVGAFHGTVLLQIDARLPRLRARLASVVWKGKVFEPDGSFINQWAGFRAVPSQVAVGASWYDGQSCLVLEYPANSAVFANTRDELREIAPGVFLGRFYERCLCPKLQGYFILEMECVRKGDSCGCH